MLKLCLLLLALFTDIKAVLEPGITAVIEPDMTIANVLSRINFLRASRLNL